FRADPIDPEQLAPEADERLLDLVLGLDVRALEVGSRQRDPPARRARRRALGLPDQPLQIERAHHHPRPVLAAEDPLERLGTLARRDASLDVLRELHLGGRALAIARALASALELDVPARERPPEHEVDLAGDL